MDNRSCGLPAGEIEDVLLYLLDGAGTEWTREGGWVRWRTRRGALVWETYCRAARGRFECYGRYPFAVPDRETALRRVNEINLRTTAGAMLLPEDSRPVFRSAAEPEELYQAEDLLRRTLERNAGAVVRYWGLLAPADI